MPTIEELAAGQQKLAESIDAIRAALVEPVQKREDEGRTLATDKTIKDDIEALLRWQQEYTERQVALEERLNGAEAAKNRRGIHAAGTSVPRAAGGPPNFREWAKRICQDARVKSLRDRDGLVTKSGWIPMPDNGARRGREFWQRRRSGLLTRAPVGTSSVPTPKQWANEWTNDLPGINLIADRIQTVTIDGNTYTFVKQTATYRVIATITTAVGSGDSTIVVQGGYGFRVGATVYADAAQTKSAVISSIAYDSVAKTATITLTGATGFTASAGDELWSTSYAYTPETKLAPYGEIKWGSVDVTLVKLIVIFGVSTEALEDEDRLAMELESQGMLEFDLNKDTQIVKGSGSNNEIEGIRNNSDIPTYSQSAVATDNKTNALRRARGLVRKSRIPADTAVISVDDMTDIDVDQTEDGEYVTAIEGGRVWLMDVIESDSLAAGEAIVGNFQYGLQIAEKRQGIDVQVTDSHGDNFAEDVSAMKMRKRLNLVTRRPQALVNVTLTT